VRTWHRADAAASKAERAAARREAEEYSALAQEVGAYREALTEVAGARRRWHAATELDRQRGFAADAELRRRHPDADLPPLHPADESSALKSAAATGQAGPGTVPDRRGAVLDVKAALAAARVAEKILAERGRQVELDGDDVMRRREAEAMREASARRSAVRQDPAPSRRTMSFELEEPELEAGH